jgi:hypothetical protein
VGLLARLLGRKPRRATEHERAVARHLLTGDDPRHELLARQLEYASVKRSTPDETSIEFSPEYTTDDLTFPFEMARLESGWTPLRDLLRGRELQFRVVVVRSGFMSIQGRTADGGTWPEGWKPDLSVPVDPELRLRLPSREAIERQQREARVTLEKWLGGQMARDMETFPPATEAQLAGRELELRGTFPRSLRGFFAISDGLESNDFRFCGHADVYPVDSPHVPALLLAWDSDNRDDFIVAVSLAGVDESVYRLDVHVDVPEAEVIAPDVRTYLAQRLV